MSLCTYKEHGIFQNLVPKEVNYLFALQTIAQLNGCGHFSPALANTTTPPPPPPPHTHYSAFPKNF